MGSFNVGCGISNLSINEGDKVGFVLLAPNTEDWRNQTGKSSYIYTTDNYLPFLPPIYGEYNDYGDVTNIQESETTRLIENLFQLPVEKVISGIGNHGREYYSDYGIIFENFVNNKEVFGDWETPTFDVLKNIGFTEPDETVRANMDKILGDTLEYLFWGEDYLVILDEKKETITLFRVEEEGALTRLDSIRQIKGNAKSFVSKFAQVSNIFPEIDKEKWEAVKLLTRMSGMFFLKDVHNEMKEFLSSDVASYEKAWLNKEKKNIKNFFDAFKKETPEQFDSAIIVGFQYFNKASSFFTATKPGGSARKMLGKGYSRPKEWLDLRDFGRVLTAVNRMYQPSFSGEQFGNNEASLRLNRVTDSILKTRKAEFDN